MIEYDLAMSFMVCKELKLCVIWYYDDPVCLFEYI